MRKWRLKGTVKPGCFVLGVMKSGWSWISVIESMRSVQWTQGKSKACVSRFFSVSLCSWRHGWCSPLSMGRAPLTWGFFDLFLGRKVGKRSEWASCLCHFLKLLQFKNISKAILGVMCPEPQWDTTFPSTPTVLAGDENMKPLGPPGVHQMGVGIGIFNTSFYPVNAQFHEKEVWISCLDCWKILG